VLFAVFVLYVTMRPYRVRFYMLSSQLTAFTFSIYNVMFPVCYRCLYYLQGPKNRAVDPGVWEILTPENM